MFTLSEQYCVCRFGSYVCFSSSLFMNYTVCHKRICAWMNVFVRERTIEQQIHLIDPNFFLTLNIFDFDIKRHLIKIWDDTQFSKRWQNAIQLFKFKSRFIQSCLHKLEKKSSFSIPMIVSLMSVCEIRKWFWHWAPTIYNFFWIAW